MATLSREVSCRFVDVSTRMSVRITRLANAEPARERLCLTLAPFEQDGKSVMGSSSWTITARKPQG